MSGESPDTRCGQNAVPSLSPTGGSFDSSGQQTNFPYDKHDIRAAVRKGLNYIQELSDAESVSTTSDDSWDPRNIAGDTTFLYQPSRHRNLSIDSDFDEDNIFRSVPSGIDTFGIFIYQMFTLTGHHRVLALYQYAIPKLGGITEALELLAELFAQGKEIGHDLLFEPASWRTKTEKGLDVFDELLNNPAKIIERASGMHLKRIVTYLCFCCLVPKSMVDPLRFIKLINFPEVKRLNDHGQTIDDVTQVLRSLSTLVRMAISENTIIDLSDSLGYITEVDKLIALSSCVIMDGCTPPPEEYIYHSEFTRRVISAYNVSINRSMAFTTRCPMTTLHLKRCSEAISRIYSELSARSNRDPPLNIGIYGDSNAGKTSVLAADLSYWIMRGHGMSDADSRKREAMCMLNVNDQYSSSYIPLKSQVVVIDEVAAYVGHERRTSLINTQFLEMLSGGELLLNRAGLEEKGKVRYRPKGHILLSNKRDFGLRSVLTTPEAGYNRLHLVFSVRIKPEYLVKDGDRSTPNLDRAKVDAVQAAIVEECGGDHAKAKLREEYWPTVFYYHTRTTEGFTTEQGTENRITYAQMCDMVMAAAQAHNRSIQNSRDRTRAIPTECRGCHKVACECMFSDLFEPAGFKLPVSFVRPFFQPIREDTLSAWEEFSVMSIIFFRFLFYLLIKLVYDFLPRALQQYIANWILTRWGQQIVSNELATAYYKAGRKLRSVADRDFQKLAYKYIYREYGRAFKWAGIITIGVVSVAVVRKLVSSWVKEDDEAYQPSGRNFSRDGEQPDRHVGYSNPWVNRRNDSHLLGKAANTPEAVLKKKLERNTLMFYIIDTRTDKIEERSYIVNIDSSYWVGVHHSLRFMEDPNYIIRVFEFSSEEEGRIVPIPLKDIRGGRGIFKKVGTDLAMVNLLSLPPRSSLRGVLLRDLGSLRHLEAWTTQFVEGKPQHLEISVERSNIHYTPYPERGRISSECFSGVCHPGSQAGQCGSALSARVGNNLALVGFEVAGTMSAGTGHVAFEPLTSRQVEEAAAYFAQMMFSPASSEAILPCFKDHEISPTTSKDHVWWIDPQKSGTIEPVGALRHISVSRPKSHVVNFVGHEEIKQVLGPAYTHDLTAPIFKDFRNSDGEFKSLYKNMLDQVSSNATGINPAHMAACIRAVTKRFMSETDFHDIQIWNAESCVSGSSINSFCKSLPKTTSAGFGFKGKKVDHLEFAPSETAPDGYIPGPALKQKIREIIDLYAQKKRYGFVYVTCPKDEPRARSKVADRKIRVFTISSVDQVIIHRMFTGHFMGLFLKHFHTCETVGGVNCYGPEWGEVRERLGKHPHVINGDYSAFDKTVSPMVILGAAQVIKNCIMASYPGDQVCSNILDALFTDVAYPLVLMQQSLIQIAGSLSSGIALTFTLNNIQNSLYIRLAWLSIFAEPNASEADLDAHLASFEENVCFYALGDDNTMSVSSKVIDRFNFQTIQKYFTSIGVKYTPADKSDREYLYEGLENASIGKRKWVWDPEWIKWLCPIEKPSIGKTLTIGLAGGPLTMKQKLHAATGSALFDLAQYGDEEYARVVSGLQGVSAYPPGFVFKSREAVMAAMSNGKTPWDSSSFPDLEMDPAGLSCDDLANQLSHLNTLKSFFAVRMDRRSSVMKPGELFSSTDMSVCPAQQQRIPYPAIGEKQPLWLGGLADLPFP